MRRIVLVALSAETLHDESILVINSLSWSYEEKRELRNSNAIEIIIIIQLVVHAQLSSK